MRATRKSSTRPRATAAVARTFVDAKGDVSAVLPGFTTGVLTGEVRAYTGITPYTRYGNWLALLLIFASLAIALRTRRHSTAPA